MRKNRVIMGAITIIREIKQIHPNYVALVRMGGFYRVYGKDAYILSNIFEYKIKQEEERNSLKLITHIILLLILNSCTKLLRNSNGTNVKECKNIENIKNP